MAHLFGEKRFERLFQNAATFELSDGLCGLVARPPEVASADQSPWPPGCLLPARACDKTKPA
jgi:hypothetical protein